MPFIRRFVLAAMLSALTSTASRAAVNGVLDPARSPRNASYTITARLDPATRTITGSESITWRNLTAAPATELQFHLYWNAWINTRTTFMRERALGGGRQDPPRAADEWARVDITGVRVLGRDLTATRRFIAPDDDNPNDQTVMSIPLPEPIAPGASAEDANVAGMKAGNQRGILRAELILFFSAAPRPLHVSGPFQFRQRTLRREIGDQCLRA
jgi:hypothetical protein